MSTAVATPSQPPELASLGEPEQVFDLSAGSISKDRMFCAITCVVGVVFCFALGVPLLVCGIKPFGKSAPPPEVCFSVGGVLAVLGMSLAWGAYYCVYGSRWSTGTYHLYRDCLVVVGPDHNTRKLAWDQIGPEKAPSSLNPRHTFPVDAEPDLDFNCWCADHEALASEIARKSAQARWTRILTPIVAAKLATGQPVPAFLVYDSSETSLYRVSPLAGYMFFVRVGEGCAAGTRGFAWQSLPGHGGPAGGVAGWRQIKQAERLQQTLDALEAADERGLFDLAAGLKGSRLLAVEELADVHFDKPSPWEKFSIGVSVVTVLKFTHPEWGDKKMHFESLPQLSEASRLLGELLNRDFSHEALTNAQA